MSEFSQDDSLELALLPEALNDLRDKAAESLVLHGRKKEERGVTDLEGNVLYSYNYPLPGKLVRDIFLKDKNDIVTVQDCYIEYIPKYRLGEPDDDPRHHTLHQDTIFLQVKYSSSLGVGKAPLETTCTWVIGGRLGEVIEGTYDSELSIDGKIVTMSGVDYSRYPLECMNEEEIREVIFDMIDDRLESQRSISLDDQQKICKVVEYVASDSPLVA